MKAKSGYSAVLEWGSRLGFALAILTFLVYASEVLPSTVRIGEIDRYWSLPLAEYVAATGIATGPGAWISLLDTGNGLAALPAILFSVLALAAYLAIAIPTIRDRDYVYALLILLEAALIVATVAGLIGG